MLTGSSIIIHTSPIIQQGLKSILQSRNIGINDVLNSLSEYKKLNDTKDCLILIDTQYNEDLNKHRQVLKKNRNTIIGIANIGISSVFETVFDDLLFINDTTDTIIHKISVYTDKVTSKKMDNQLSERETEVLIMVAQGFSNKQIAGRLFLSIHTVITHRKNITFKLGIKSISGLTLYAALNNMIELR